jgi:hypothetical protein
MRRVLLTLAFAVLLVPMPAARGFFAVALVSGQDITCTGNDATCTFPSPPSASNCVVVASIINDTSQTLDLTGVPGGATETVIHGPDNQNSLRGYIYTFPGDGSDATFVTTTSSTAAARTAAAEFSGLDCSGSGEDGTSVSVADNVSPYNLSPTITTTASGSLLFGLAHSTSAGDFSASGSTTSIPSDGTEINTVALGGYIILGAAAAYDLPFTSAAAENTHLMAAAIKASAGGGATPSLRMLLGIGGER